MTSGSRLEACVGVVGALALAAGACAGGSNDAAAPADRRGSAPPTSSTTVVVETTTTTEPPCPTTSTAGETPPDSFRRSLDEGLLRLVSSAPNSQFTVSIRVDGYGEVLAHDPDLALSPASNQKLLTAYGALSTLDLFRGLTTTVTATAAPDAQGTLSGDLVLIAGADPTLTTRGEHSLRALADQVAATGLTQVTGRLLVDDSRYESVLIPDGWPDFHVPQYGGPLSALMVDDNEARADPAFLADPDLEHTRTFGALLADRGIVVAGGVERSPGSTEADFVLATVESAPVGSLIADFLLNSDNESADLLMREIGRVVAGSGTLANGLERTRELFSEVCLELAGGLGDGSGVSRANLRSAREMRRIVDLLLVDPLGPAVLDSLPVAARTGTLAGRFNGTSAAGVLRAKSGSIIGGKAITGQTRTADGRTATFSIIVNGPDAINTTTPMDALLVHLSD